MNAGRRTTAGLLVVALLAVLGACATTPSAQFYTLSAGPAAAAPPSPDLDFALGPIDLPRYLDRPQIVSRLGDNRLQVDEFNRWGGALDEEIGRALIARLRGALGSDRVYDYPSRIVSDIDYRVALDLRSFDGVLGGPVTLAATWSLIDGVSGEVLRTEQAAFTGTSETVAYTAYAATLSRLLDRLADEIAVVLRGLPQPRIAEPAFGG